MYEYEVCLLAAYLAVALFWTRSCLVINLCRSTYIYIYIHFNPYICIYIYRYSFCLKVIWALWHFNKGFNWQKAKDSFRSNEEKEIPEHMMLEGFRWSISHLAYRLVFLAWPYWSLGCFLKDMMAPVKAFQNHIEVYYFYSRSMKHVGPPTFAWTKAGHWSFLGMFRIPSILLLWQYPISWHVSFIVWEQAWRALPSLVVFLMTYFPRWAFYNFQGELSIIHVFFCN